MLQIVLFYFEAMGLFIGNHFHFCLESIFGRGVVELFK